LMLIVLSVNRLGDELQDWLGLRWNLLSYWNLTGCVSAIIDLWKNEQSSHKKLTWGQFNSINRLLLKRSSSIRYFCRL